VKPRLDIRRLATPGGDDLLALRAEGVLPDSALDPVATGVGLVIAEAPGARLLDLSVPGGAYDRATRVGWKTSAAGVWRYVNRSAAPAAGIVAVTIRDLSRRMPGLIQLTVRGRRGSYAVVPGNLPLTGLVVLDPPTAPTGQCVEATFTAPASTCTTDGRSVRCG
jgi:hypothetical protein